MFYYYYPTINFWCGTKSNKAVVKSFENGNFYILLKLETMS